jgi:hypothetical protein
VLPTFSQLLPVLISAWVVSVVRSSIHLPGVSQFSCLCLFSARDTVLFCCRFNMDADYVDLTAVQGELEVGPPSPHSTSPTSGPAEFAVALAANPAVTAALSRDPSLGATATACLAAAKAAGTVRGYSGTLRRYNAFCALAGLEPLSLTEDVLIQFILHLDQREAGFHLLASVKPALVYLASTLGVPPGFTPAADLLLAGAKRRARALAGPARKAPALSPEDWRRFWRGSSRHATRSVWLRLRRCARLSDWSWSTIPCAGSPVSGSSGPATSSSPAMI